MIFLMQCYVGGYCDWTQRVRDIIEYLEGTNFAGSILKHARTRVAHKNCSYTLIG